LAREFASFGCRIALCARDQNELERARQTFARAGHEVFTVTCDISDREAALVEAVRRHYGNVDILVNNAGEIMVSPFENLKIADFERAIDVMFGARFIQRSPCCP
jgi:NADP-dependent 3-hydroxy acid dehydrogenase YdfG